jgi:hypothetical protein
MWYFKESIQYTLINRKNHLSCYLTLFNLPHLQCEIHLQFVACSIATKWCPPVIIKLLVYKAHEYCSYIYNKP